MPEIKSKKYSIEVRSHVSATMIVFANSKQEAYKIADIDIRESLQRKLSYAIESKFIKDIDGYAEALKSTIKLHND